MSSSPAVDHKMTFAPDRAHDTARPSTMGSSILDQEQAQAQAIHPVAVAKFDGSFAPNARPIAPTTDVPWYRNREYLLSGWTNEYVWKAAVCHLRPHSISRGVQVQAPC